MPIPTATRSSRIRPLQCVVVLGIGLLSLAAATAGARPERIQPGQVYYSDDFVVEGVVRDLAGEKNYEEVYQSYRYYEAIYDESERVVTFRKVQRGEVVQEDRYRYAGDSPLPVEHIAVVPGQPPETTRLDASD